MVSCIFEADPNSKVAHIAHYHIIFRGVLQMSNKIIEIHRLIDIQHVNTLTHPDSSPFLGRICALANIPMRIVSS